MNTLKPYAPVIIRIGMGAVFLWFGFDQFIHTSDWLAYVPQSISDMLHIGAATLVHINGAFEIIFGLALTLGFYTRLAAFLLALHLLDITCIVGYSALGVRDFGLSLTTISVWLHGSDFFSLDRYLSEDSAPTD